MKDYLRQILEEAEPSPLVRINLAREYLQARILQALQDSGAFVNWAFLGGTALRFLYGLRRYSEDCDFSIIDSKRPDNFNEVVRNILRAFEAEGYEPDAKSREKKTVRYAFIRFRELLHELGLSPRSNQVLSVKIELDTNPPEGAAVETTLVRRYVTLNLAHYDKSSLLAGKLHALLSRHYTKGRDLYDLVWYLADPEWPEPNLLLLNNALKQTGWSGPTMTPENWRSTLASRFEVIDWRRVAEDIRPFLSDPGEIAMLNEATCRKLLSK